MLDIIYYQRLKVQYIPGEFFLFIYKSIMDIECFTNLLPGYLFKHDSFS